MMKNAEIDTITPFHISLITMRGHAGELCFKDATDYRARITYLVIDGWQIIDTLRGFNPDWAVTVMYRARAV